MPVPPIQYLRWARSRQLDPDRDQCLILSGMSPPDPDFIGDFSREELLSIEPGDQIRLGADIAAAWDDDPARILVQPGTHWTLYAVLAARLAQRPGPVVIEQPAYEPLRRIPAALGAAVLRLPRPRARGFAIDFDALDRLAERSPSALILTHPHNPSGALLSGEDQDRLLAWSQATGCALISDEVYVEFLPDPEAETLAARSEDILTLRSFTKVMGLGSLRATIARGPADWIAETAVFSDYGAVGLPGPNQALARRAFEHRDELHARARSVAAAGRAVMETWLAGQKGRVDAFLPDAGIICFPRLSAELREGLLAHAAGLGGGGPYGFGLDEDPTGSHVWIEALARHEHVHLTPGAFFEDAQAFRLGFGLPPERLRLALERIDSFFARALEDA